MPRPTEPTISPLSDKAEINEAWKKHRHHVLNALEHSDHAFSEEHILMQALTGETQIWSGEKSILITQVRQYPNFKAISMSLAGGDLEELREMERQVVEIAKAHGCTKAVIIGRAGWLRALDDYQLMSVNLTKDI